MGSCFSQDARRLQRSLDSAKGVNETIVDTYQEQITVKNEALREIERLRGENAELRDATSVLTG